MTSSALAGILFSKQASYCMSSSTVPRVKPPALKPGDMVGVVGPASNVKRGELEAGPRPDGGWLVRARIPADLMPTVSPVP